MKKNTLCSYFHYDIAICLHINFSQNQTKGSFFKSFMIFISTLKSKWALLFSFFFSNYYIKSLH